MSSANGTSVKSTAKASTAPGVFGIVVRSLKLFAEYGPQAFSELESLIQTLEGRAKTPDAGASVTFADLHAEAASKGVDLQKVADFVSTLTPPGK